MLQIKALHQDYVALQKQILKKNLQTASKETKAFIKLVEQKTGQPFLKILALKISLINLSDNTIFYKPENDSTALELVSGAFLTTPIDGIAIASHPNEVYKISDGVFIGNIVIAIAPNGEIGLVPIITSIGDATNFIIGGGIEIISYVVGRSGWKDQAWLRERQAKKDNNWNQLFAASATF